MMKAAAGERGGARERWLRLGLVVLAVPQAATGLWALASPSHWYAEYPGWDRAWVSTLGPFNEHLARDTAAGFVALGVLLLWAAVVPERRLVQAALATWLVAQVPHFAYHLTTLDEFPVADAVANVVTFSVAVGLPLVLLALTRQPGPARRDGDAVRAG